jgi:hypothetical protein
MTAAFDDGGCPLAGAGRGVTGLPRPLATAGLTGASIAATSHDRASVPMACRSVSTASVSASPGPAPAPMGEV